MTIQTKPITGYAFKHRETGALSLILFLGTGDSIDNYVEITKQEYDELKRLEERQSEEMP